MITITFPPSRAAVYRYAAAAAPGLVDGWHVATYPFPELGVALALWNLVRRLRGATFELDGVRLYGRGLIHVLQVLECALTAQRLDPPAIYCRAGLPVDPAQWDDVPVVPCRLFMDRYAWPMRSLDWTNPLTRIDAVKALLARYEIDRCPLLNLDGWAAVLERWEGPRHL